jgi:myo-inositol-1(or 4)-monophosphatase
MTGKPRETATTEVLASMTTAAQAAGRAAFAYFRSGTQTSAKVTIKVGDSPVTEADYAANAVLFEQLCSIWSGYGWISEEDADSPERLTRNRLFVVDPIDGTRAFIAGKPEWCVSVGLVEGQRPIAGVIHLPVLGLTYAAALGEGAFLNGKPITCSKSLTLAGSRYAGPKSYLDQLQRQTESEMQFMPRVPSLAYRLAQAASGQVDLAIASTGSHDWDVAAADIILNEAGAVLLDTAGERLIYNRATLGRDELFAGPVALVMLANEAVGLRNERSKARTP